MLLAHDSSFLLAFVFRLEGLVLCVVLCCDLPEDGEFPDCQVLDFFVFVVEVLGDDIAENFRKEHVELFEELHDLVVSITRFIEQRPKRLDDISAVVLSSRRRGR